MTIHRIGVLGGTFNPVHRGHVELGLQVCAAYRLDEVFYLLSARPPHKSQQRLANVMLRWKMLNLALEPFPKLIPCDVEMRENRPSWTVDTIDVLERERPGDRFLFISGSEGFLKITTWKAYRDLLERIPFIVVLRRKEHAARLKDLAAREEIKLGSRYIGDGESPPFMYLYRYNSDILDISSTMIRRRRRQSQSISSLVHPGVEKLIREENLYAT